MGYEPELWMDKSRLDARTGNGQPPQQRISVREYMKMQGRFAYLSDADIEAIERDIDEEWELLLAKDSVAAVIGQVASRLV